MSDFFSIRDMAVEDMDYDAIEYIKGVSLRERPFRARTAWLEDPWKDLGHSQADHVDVLVGTQIDTHDEWLASRAGVERLGRLGWKNYFFPYTGDPISLYPGQVDLIDKGTHWWATTRAHDRGSSSGTIGVEVQSTGKIKESGTYRVSGLFDNIKYISFSSNGLRQEEFHVYVIQSESGYLEGTTQNTFAWVYHTGGGTWTDSNAIHETEWAEQKTPLPIDYTFQMNADLPYVTFIVRQMTLYAPDGERDNTTEGEFKNFKVERVA